MSHNVRTSNIEKLNNLWKEINEIKGENTTYEQLVENTNKLLNKKLNKTNKELIEIIKNNFMKYIKILTHLYAYYIHYENLLEQFANDTNFCELFKGMYKKTIQKNNKELTAERIRRKILYILYKQKINVRELLTNIADKIIENFNSLSDEDYQKIIEEYSKNNRIRKLLRMFVSIKKKNQSEKNLFSRLIKNLNKVNSRQIQSNNRFEQINFSQAKTKQNYLNIIHSSISEQQEDIIRKINSNIKKSLEDLNKIKKNINNSYKKQNNTNNPNI